MSAASSALEWWGRRRLVHPGQLAGAAAAVVAGTLLVKVIAVGKEFVVAGAYGRSDAMDAFLAAFLVPSLLINLIAESMSQALVPTLIRVRLHQGRQQAQRLLAASLARLSVGLLAACAIAATTAPWWIRFVGWGFSASKLALTLHLFYGVILFVVLGGMAATCGAVLNGFKRYATPALAPGIIPLTTIGGAALLAPALGIWALVVASVAGAALYAAAMAAGMARAGYPIRLQWRHAPDSTRDVSRQYGAVLLSSVVASGGLLVDQVMAATLAPGSVSALAFAGRFVSVVLALAAGAASAVLGPYLATLTASKDWTGCRAALRRWTRIAWACTIPVAVALAFWARALVHVCLEHGAFSARDTRAVVPVLACAAIQIPFFAASRVHYRFVLAMRRADLILYCGILNLVLDVALNLLLMRWMGVAGIALATSLWTITTWVFFAQCSRWLLRGTDEQEL